MFPFNYKYTIFWSLAFLIDLVFVGGILAPTLISTNSDLAVITGMTLTVATVLSLLFFAQKAAKAAILESEGN